MLASYNCSRVGKVGVENKLASFQGSQTLDALPKNTDFTYIGFRKSSLASPWLDVGDDTEEEEEAAEEEVHNEEGLLVSEEAEDCCMIRTATFLVGVLTNLNNNKVKKGS